MARTRTLAQLRTQARRRSDQENSQHCVDSEIDGYLNDSIAALHALRVEAGEDDLTTTSDFNTANGTEVYSLVTATGSSSFYKLRSMHVSQGGRYRELARWNLSEWSAFQNSVTVGGVLSGAPAFYRIVGNSVYLEPTPQGVYSVRIFWIASPTALAADGDTYDGNDGWEEWVVCDTAIKMMRKEETDTREMVAEREKVEARILSQMRRTDQAKPHRVNDVAGRYGDDIFGPHVRVVL